MAGSTICVAALGAALPVPTTGLLASSYSSAPTRPSSSLRCRPASRVAGFFDGSVPGAVSLRHLVHVGQRITREVRAGSSSSLPVFVAAAAATAVEEAAAPPAVTTESVPRPKKIGKGIVRLRLTRLGRKKRPFYRIVATHCSWRRDGKYIELLGHYNPLHAKDDLGIVVKADRIKYWLGVGAQPSDTVTGILHKVGILKKIEEQ